MTDITDIVGRTVRSFEIQSFVGKGGHGAVFRAHHKTSGEDVALKVILPEHDGDATLLERFQQEADIIRELHHPHIVHLIDFWEDEDGMWVAMQWLGGGDLREYLQKHGKMPLRELAPLLLQVTNALDAAHAANIIHRDLKPDNIVLDEEGNAYLTDFGIAKRMGYKAITSMGVVVGSPNYLSPEQILGSGVSARTDVFALGFMMYEMITGKHPFHTIKNRVQLMMAMMQQEIPPITDLDPALADDLNLLLQRATSKDAEERYPSASALAQEYAKIVDAK